MRIHLDAPELDVVEAAASKVVGGGVVLYPSDTVYGLGCDPLNEEALRRIFRIKQRPVDAGLLVLIRDVSEMERFANPVPGLAYALARQFWPGPLTLVLTARGGLPGLLVGDPPRIGLRRPASTFLQTLLRQLPNGLVSTSANRSGQAVSSSTQRLLREFGERVDLFIEADRPLGRLGSSVVDLSGPEPRLTRPGPESREIEAFLKAEGDPLP